MAPHLLDSEINYLFKLKDKGLAPTAIHEKLVERRAKKDIEAPSLPNLRKALKGKTYKRGKVETRGRNRALTPAKLRSINAKRKNLIKKAAGQKEIHWADIARAARVKCDPTTLAKSMRRAGIDVRARKPREKPLKDDVDIAERKRVCNQWRKKSVTYWKNMDLIMDNKTWDFPTHVKAKKVLKMRKVRFHIRERAEGLKPGFTKPSTKKHTANPGGCVKLLAGIVKGRVRVWHYLPKTWNAKVAEECYRGPIIKVLRRTYPGQKSFKILEDNDPSGYKSNKAVAAKTELKINPIEFPAYSPDLNPCDYFLWDEVQRRMEEQKPRGRESVDAFKIRLRRTAMSIPPSIILKGVAGMKTRSQQVFEADGHDIKRD